MGLVSNQPLMTAPGDGLAARSGVTGIPALARDGDTDYITGFPARPFWI
jgi:hypothetical protein